jgi:hypothetical protein
MYMLGLDEDAYKEIWHAPEGHVYATQFRRQGERDWMFADYALSKNIAYNWFASVIGDNYGGSEYRIVILSRYPPCSVSQIVKHFEAKK